LPAASIKLVAPHFVLRQEASEKSVGKGIGAFFGAWQIEGVQNPEAFKIQVDK
jgi:hypothetical protein